MDSQDSPPPPGKLMHGLRGDESNSESTVSSTVKLILPEVRKFLADSRIWQPTAVKVEQAKWTISQMDALIESLRVPVAEGDIVKRVRGEVLEQRIKSARDSLFSHLDQIRMRGAFSSYPRDVDGDTGKLFLRIRNAMIDYQSSLQDMFNEESQHIEDIDRSLLNGIPHASDARCPSGNGQEYLIGTRVAVSQEITRWLTGDSDQRVFWLNGLAGTGKSAIARVFAEMAVALGELGASFFCSRGSEDRSDLQMIFPTLALQLAYKYPAFRKELLQAMRVHLDVWQGTLASQMEKIIVGPLKAARISTLIIIDALDECKDEEPTSSILSVLSHYVDDIPRVKFFITGRPEPQLRFGFRLSSLTPITKVLKLHEVDRGMVDSDIELFFRTRLTYLVKNRRGHDLTEDWPNSSDVEILCRKAAGFFTYASAIVKFVASENHLPSERLTRITSFPQSTAEEGKFGVDLLYTQVLEQAVRHMRADDEEFSSNFRTVVGAVSLVFNPLSAEALSNLLGVANISSILRPLHSLLLVPDSIKDPIRIFHSSFPDFLTDPARCRDERFFVEPTIRHTGIILSCLNLMSERLKKNICNLDDHAVLSRVEDLSTRRKDNIGDALEYACHFWTKHLLGIPNNDFHVEEVQKAIDEFFTTHFLYWIEVLALTSNFDVGVYAMNDVERWSASTGVSCKWTNDGHRFLSEHFDTIRDSPSQIYHSALPLCPTSSWIREYYGAELSREIKVVRGLPVEWGNCSRTVSFGGTPLALACWRDLVAVGSWFGDIIILNAITGSHAAVLSAHADRVGSLAFSTDGTLLVSGSDDRTVKLWDVQAGGVTKPFHGHTLSVRSVSISPDRTTIASGSLDNTIRLWDIQTGECRCVIDGPKGNINSVSFSPTNPQLLISASGDHTIRRWDVKGRKIGATHRGDHATLSPDGTFFVSWRGRVATVRRVDSGAVFAELRVSDGDFRCCCFSPDGKTVAGGVGRTIYIWDITGPDPGHPVETLVGHTDTVTSLTFSTSLISASRDNTIKFWRIGTLSTVPAMVGPKPTSSVPLPPIPITSISLQTRDGIAISSDSAGVVRTWDLSTGLCIGVFRTAVKGGRDTRLVDGRLIIVCDGEDRPDEGRGANRAGEIQIWDVERNELLRAVNTSERRVIDLWISGDGAKVFCLGEGSVRAWSTWTGEDAGRVTFQDQLQPDSLTVAGSRVWVHFARSPPRGWDFGIPGSPPVPLSNSSPNKPRLDITDGTDGANTNAAKVRDAATGREFFQLSGRFSEPCATQCDHRYLVAGYEFGEVLILDLLPGS